MSNASVDWDARSAQRAVCFFVRVKLDSQDGEELGNTANIRRRNISSIAQDSKSDNLSSEFAYDFDYPLDRTNSGQDVFDHEDSFSGDKVLVSSANLDAFFPLFVGVDAEHLASAHFGPPMGDPL